MISGLISGTNQTASDGWREMKVMGIEVHCLSYVAPGLPGASYSGGRLQCHGCDHGLVVNFGKQVLLVTYQGEWRMLYQGSVPVSTKLCSMGAIIQNGNIHSLVTFDGSMKSLVTDSNEMSHPCKDGIIIPCGRARFDFISFECERRTIWQGNHGLYTVVSDGLVTCRGKHRYNEVVVTSPDGNTRTIWDRADASCGFCSLGLHAVANGKYYLVPFDERPPAVYDDLSIQHGACCNGLVVENEHQITIVPFGGSPKLFWSSPRGRWSSCSLGLLVEVDDCLLLVKYDGKPTRVVWRGPHQEWFGCDTSLVIMSGSDIVAIDLRGA